ncbi:hypothetical protein B0T16DRAFT_452244 [Cercophora newfieldiana]|uniref:Extracellular serine-rich protein n=1 Tax=Cercophora newfieldiana TaxID=92897 RepID=A0AA39YQ88_9PEZI|nr:hypothetical protein B0T16DRAFT_452244 [Cercophora newfieldiana]
MLTSYLLTAVVALAAGGVHAQSGTPTSGTGASTATPSPSSTGSPKPKTVEINVGAEVHKFTPDSVTANVGDTIRFNFYPGGHRVARAEYKQPCIPYEYTGAGKKGFWTGIFSPQVITVPAPHYDVLVNDTEPIFFYCGAPGSCNQYSMVGVVNPTKEMTLETQKEFAANSSLQLVPGEPFPSETLKPTNTPTATPAPGSDSANGQKDGGSSNDATKDSGNSGLGTGAIAGIAIGAAAVLVLGAGIIYLCGRRGGFERAYRKGFQPGGPHASIPPGAMVPGMAEARYHDPKSPGQHTVATFPGSERDYRFSAQTQTPLAGHFTGTPPPPGSPGLNGFGAYQQSVAPSQQYDNASQHGFYAGVTSPQPLPSPQFPQSPPSELPAADHPAQGHSPPPQYGMERRDSHTTGGAVTPSKFK